MERFYKKRKIEKQKKASQSTFNLTAYTVQLWHIRINTTNNILSQMD